MKLADGVDGDARPRGHDSYRQWLSRSWEPSLPVALVIGINPNRATESSDDAMTNFLTRLLRKLEGPYRCGGYYLVNCFDFRERHPKSLLDAARPNSAHNDRTIAERLNACDFVVASWGTTRYGPLFEQRRREIARMVRESGKPAVCFSPVGAPVYCSQTNANNPDGRWCPTPVPWK